MRIVSYHIRGCYRPEAEVAAALFVSLPGSVIPKILFQTVDPTQTDERPGRSAKPGAIC